MITFFIVLSSVLTVASVLPYIRDIIRGKTKPRIVSWFTWTLLTAIGCAASFAAGAYAAGILLLFAAAETLSIVVLGWKYGDRKFERLDVACQIGALVGLALWLLLDSPLLAITVTIIIDFVGGLPTLKHIWQRPYEETWLTFLLGGLGPVCTLAATRSWAAAAIAFPVYLAVFNLFASAVIVMRKRHTLSKQI